MLTVEDPLLTEAADLGTGIVWSADGVIVTADHVVEREEGIEVLLPGGESVKAELIGRDPSTDVAALIFNTHGESMGRGGHPDYYRLYKAGGAMDEACAGIPGFPEALRAGVEGGGGHVVDPDISPEVLVKVPTRQLYVWWDAGLWQWGKGRL